MARTPRHQPRGTGSFSFMLGLVALLAALIAMTGPDLAAQSRAASTDTTQPPLVVAGRSMITTKLGIVASSQPLASQAGAQILTAGGNAIDAAIAANAVLGLTEPMMNGIGGDLFAIVYEAKTGKVYGLNASGWAASGVTADLVAAQSPNGRMPQSGVWSVTVPGMVAGWTRCARSLARSRLTNCSRRPSTTRSMDSRLAK